MMLRLSGKSRRCLDAASSINGRNSSSLKDLLVALEKQRTPLKPDLSKAATAQSRISNPSTPATKLSFSSTNSSSLASLRQMIQKVAPKTATTLGTTPSSFRTGDVLKNFIGNKDKNASPLKSTSIRGAAISGANLTGNARTIGSEILQGLKTVAATANRPDAVLNSIEDSDPSTLTPGELRYQKHLQRLKQQKVSLQHRMSPFTSGNIPIHQNLNDQKDSVDESPKPKGPVGKNDSMVDISVLKNQTARALKQMSWQQMHDQNARKYGTKEKQSSSLAPKKANSEVVVKEIELFSTPTTLRSIAIKANVKPAELIKRLQDLGEDLQSYEVSEEEAALSASNGQSAVSVEHAALLSKLIDPDVAELVLLEMGFNVKKVTLEKQMSKLRSKAGRLSKDEGVALSQIAPSKNKDGQQLHFRSPVVCIMGHVDHGKTTLLDTLRKAKVAASEAGGITQRLSAFVLNINSANSLQQQQQSAQGRGPRSVVFLDTPGHAAFSGMRSHGASATDVVVLIVAADDGVRPQTKESIETAKQSGCAIIIALNKMDKIPAGPERVAARSRVLTQLMESNLVAEDFGGDVQVVEVSGKTGEGLDQLTESLLLQADMMELQSANIGQAEAIVLDANMEKGRGVIADVLVKWGRLSVGDVVVVGTTFGRVKALYNDQGKEVQFALPATPVRVLGLKSVPSAGQEMLCVDSETRARQVTDRRMRVTEIKKARLDEQIFQAKAAREAELAAKAAEKLAESAEEAAATGSALVPVVAFTPITLNVLLKADGVGSLEALNQIVLSLAKRTKDVIIQTVGSSVGDITRSDVERAADTDGAIILAFNVGMSDSSCRTVAKELDVKIFRNTVIYRLEDDLTTEMQHHMPKEKIITSEGQATCLKIFKLNDKAGTVVAGLKVQGGVLRFSNGGELALAASNQTGTGPSPQPVYVFRVTRKGLVVADEEPGAMLKRFSDVVHEVAQGNECGLALQKYKDFQEGDELECLKIEWKTRKLVVEVGSAGAVPDINMKKTQNSKKTSH